MPLFESLLSVKIITMAPNWIQNLKVDALKRERLVSTAFLLGIFAALPLPDGARSSFWNFSLVTLWSFMGFLTWSNYFKPERVVLFWILSFFIAAFLYWRFSLLLPLLLLLIWAIWGALRSARVASSTGSFVDKSKSIVFLLILTLLSAANVLAQEQQEAPAAVAVPASANSPEAKRLSEQELNNELIRPAEDVKLNKQQEGRRQEAIEDFKKTREAFKQSLPRPSDLEPDATTDLMKKETIKEEIPQYMLGYKLTDISSCGVVDRIPWKFRPDQKKTRLVLKDQLRFQNHTRFYVWELFQVMDADGYVGYIVRRPITAGRYESLVVKDSTYNRILEDPKKGSRVVENQDLKNLINRETLIFYHSNGDTLSYIPSASGSSVMVVNIKTESGRQLAPIYLRGGICDRPSDVVDEDGTQKVILKERALPGAVPSEK